MDKVEKKKEEAKPDINTEVIKEHHIEQIKKEQAKVKEPEHNISVDTGKLQVKRPEMDISSIKKAIEKKLNDQNEEKPAKQSSERVASGIPGLDGVMEGGFRNETINMVGGGAGCGKSIFCMQYLVEGIEKYNENGVYISFEQAPEKLVDDCKRFNWNLDEKIKNKQLIILYYTPEQVEKILESGGGIVRDTIESINGKRLVIDSLTAFTLLFETELEKRKAVLKLFEAFEKWNTTVLVTSEQEPDPEKHKSTIMEFEVDGVILLYNIRKGDIRERSLEIFKMRATDHAAKIFPMKIDKRGVRIYPEEEVF